MAIAVKFRTFMAYIYEITTFAVIITTITGVEDGVAVANAVVVVVITSTSFIFIRASKDFVKPFSITSTNIIIPIAT